MDTETSQEVWALEATSCSFASVRAVGEDLLAVPQEGCVGIFRPDEDPRAPVALLPSAALGEVMALAALDARRLAAAYEAPTVHVWDCRQALQPVATDAGQGTEPLTALAAAARHVIPSTIFFSEVKTLFAFGMDNETDRTEL